MTEARVDERSAEAPVKIRPYEMSDESAVIGLWGEAFPRNPPWNAPAKNIRTKLTVQPELFVVAEFDELVIGTAMAGFDGHRGWVYFLAVAKAHRRRGVGQALMRHVEAALRDLGCAKLNLQVREDNEDALSFYRRIGFSPDARISMGKRLTE